eukprot:3470211-Ditylum_brightwellii.AAC.1
MASWKSAFVICENMQGFNCTMQKSRWPSAIDLCLWSYALQYKVHLHNTMPNKADEICPLE